MAPRPFITSAEHLKQMLEQVYNLHSLMKGPNKYTRKGILQCMESAGFPKGAQYYQRMLDFELVVAKRTRANLNYTEVSLEKAQQMYEALYRVKRDNRSKEATTVAKNIRNYTNEELIAELKRRHINLVPLADTDGFRIKVPYGAAIKVECTTIVTEDGIRTEVVKKQALPPRSKQTMLDK